MLKLREKLILKNKISFPENLPFCFSFLWKKKKFYLKEKHFFFKKKMERNKKFFFEKTEKEYKIE